jgi:hypothetical protein
VLRPYTGLDSRKHEKNLQIVRSYRLLAFEFRSAVRKARPLEDAAYGRLKRNSTAYAKIKRAVEALRPQQNLRVALTAAAGI